MCIGKNFAAMSISARLRKGITTDSADQTRALAAELAAALPPEATLALHGDMGVGKTTFVQGLAQGFGLPGQVTSPTFAIYSVHQGGRRKLIHLDAYRLENERQLDALLLEEFLVGPYCLAIEWPDKIAAWLPDGTMHLVLSIEDGGAPGASRHRIVLR
jgi:tRNA threonylcarbamoyladenosine biosynthesis protein TsaE